MGLRCTVFGHKWGEAGTERDREEVGDEVLVTVREVRRCRRCGAEEVLGESKEVRALEPHGTDQDGAPAEPATTEPLDDETVKDPETDDGVILEDEEPPADRGPREWPDRPEREGVEERGGEPEPWPESAREPDADEPEEAFVGADQVAEETGQVGGDDSQAADGHAPDRREPQPNSGTAEASVSERGGAPADTGRDIPEPDDDGIIEAGGAPDDEPDVDEAGGKDRAPAAQADHGTIDELDDAETGADGATGTEGATGTDGATGATESTGTDERVEIPRAEESTDRAGRDDETGPATDPQEGPGSPPGTDDQLDDDGRSSGDEPSVEPDGDTEAASSADPDGESTMGADASQRPDDDAEVLEATEPNEQSRLTAEDPVDPGEAGDSVHGGGTLDGGDPGTSGPTGTSGPQGSGARAGSETSVGGPDVSDGEPIGSGGEEPSLDPSDPPRDAEPAPEDVEYYCPECGYTDQSTWPSRRAGDICPDCQRSYLAERKT